MYVTLVSSITLGCGDLLMPHEGRVSDGLEANGLLNFGLMTAFMCKALRHVRLRRIGFTKG